MKNLPAFLNQFNWIDIFVLILTLRIIYIAFKTGLKCEFFKLLGTLSAMYLSLHYYVSLSAFLNARIFNRPAPSSLLNFVSFFFLLAFGYAIFFALRLVLSKVIKTDVNPKLDRWGGLACGAVRAVLTASILLCLFLSSSGEYFRKSIRVSFSGPRVARIAPDTYVYFWNALASKLQKAEKVNAAISGFQDIK